MTIEVTSLLSIPEDPSLRFYPKTITPATTVLYYSHKCHLLMSTPPWASDPLDPYWGYTASYLWLYLGQSSLCLHIGILLLQLHIISVFIWVNWAPLIPPLFLTALAHWPASTSGLTLLLQLLWAPPSPQLHLCPWSLNLHLGSPSLQLQMWLIHWTWSIIYLPPPQDSTPPDAPHPSVPLAPPISLVTPPRSVIHMHWPTDSTTLAETHPSISLAPILVINLPIHQNSTLLAAPPPSFPLAYFGSSFPLAPPLPLVTPALLWSVVHQRTPQSICIHLGPQSLKLCHGLLDPYLQPWLSSCLSPFCATPLWAPYLLAMPLVLSVPSPPWLLPLTTPP